jgi:hypothetical protein
VSDEKRSSRVLPPPPDYTAARPSCEARVCTHTPAALNLESSPVGLQPRRSGWRRGTRRPAPLGRPATRAAVHDPAPPRLPHSKIVGQSHLIVSLVSICAPANRQVSTRSIGILVRTRWRLALTCSHARGGASAIRSGPMGVHYDLPFHRVQRHRLPHQPGRSHGGLRNAGL